MASRARVLIRRREFLSLGRFGTWMASGRSRHSLAAFGAFVVDQTRPGADPSNVKTLLCLRMHAIPGSLDVVTAPVHFVDLGIC